MILVDIYNIRPDRLCYGLVALNILLWIILPKQLIIINCVLLLMVLAQPLRVVLSVPVPSVVRQACAAESEIRRAHVLADLVVEVQIVLDVRALLVYHLVQEERRLPQQVVPREGQVLVRGRIRIGQPVVVLPHLNNELDDGLLFASGIGQEAEVAAVQLLLDDPLKRSLYVQF